MIVGVGHDSLESGPSFMQQSLQTQTETADKNCPMPDMFLSQFYNDAL